jgi:hypothetical protein
MTKPNVPIVLRVITPTMEEVWKHSGESIMRNPYHYSVDTFSSLFQNYHRRFQGGFEVYFLPQKNTITSKECLKARAISKKRFDRIRKNHHLVFADLIVPTDFGKIDYLSEQGYLLANLYTKSEREVSIPTVLSLARNLSFKRDLEVIGAEIEQSSQSEGAQTRTEIRQSRGLGCLADYLEYFPQRSNNQP